MSTFVVHKWRCNTTVLLHEYQTSKRVCIVGHPTACRLARPKHFCWAKKMHCKSYLLFLHLPEYFWDPSSQCRVKSNRILTSCKVLIWSAVFPGSSVRLRRTVARGLRAVDSWVVLNASSFAKWVKSQPPKHSLTSFHTSKHTFKGQVSLNAMCRHGTWIKKNTWRAIRDGTYWYKRRLYISQCFLYCLSHRPYTAVL